MRALMRARLATLTAEAVRARSAAIAALLTQQPVYQSARVLMIYLALPGEVSLAALAEHAWSCGKRVAAPRVDWDARRLIPCFIESLTDGIEAGPRNVPQPVAGAATCPLGEIDLVLAPGLAFDGACFRLGRGAGFYDRFLAAPELRAVCCGAAFDEQVVEAVPRDAWDRPLDLVVSDSSVLRAART